MEALATIYTWILGPDHPELRTFPKPVVDVDRDRLIMWLYALAGAGKSTISTTTAHRCHILRILAATFFCGRDGDRSNVLAIMPTIAYQLARLCEIYRGALRKAVADNPNVHQMSVASQLEKLIVEPLCAALEGGSHAFDDAVIVVDALDECTDDEAVSVVVKSLALHHERLAPLRILVTSRPEPNINAGFVMPALAANTQHFALSEIPDKLTARDISLFLRRRLQEIAKASYIGPGWPSEDVLMRLVSLAERLFIFAATTVRFIGDDEAMDPESRLLDLLEAGGGAALTASSSTSPFWILNVLYLQVLASVRRFLGETALAQLKRILGAVVLTQDGLGPAALEALLELRPGTARRCLSRLSAVLILPAPGYDFLPIRLIHLSFSNFIVDPSRCTEPAFLITPAIHHTLLAEDCLRALLKLRHNICDVDPEYHHLLNNEIPNLQEKIARHLPPERQYAVKYWAHHLHHAKVDQQLLDLLESFCNDHLLDWLEALSLLSCVDVAVAALQSAQQLLKKLPLPPTNVVPSLYDCERIVRAFYEGISASFFEVLRATSTFAPVNSLLRQRHAADLPGMVQLRRGRDTGWSATLTSPDTRGGLVSCLDFSPDGSLLAFGTYISTIHSTIQLRNVQTGAEVHVMEGHDRSVLSLSFSPDGKALLSGGDSGSVTLWDVPTGACLGTWKRHSIWVNSLAWSSDGTLAASGSKDRTVRLWSVTSPEESTELSGHHDRVSSVVFAADGTLFSGSEDNSCKVWDTYTKSLVRTLKHGSSVCAVAVSPNGHLVACGLHNGQTVLWDKDDGVQLCAIPGPFRVRSLEFSADDTLAAAYWDLSLTLWDVKKRTPLKVMPGSRADVLVAEAAFSPDGIHIAVAMG
ncbi:WD40 repeat-like protein, partial [Trametes sanguinea]